LAVCWVPSPATRGFLSLRRPIPIRRTNWRCELLGGGGEVDAEVCRQAGALFLAEAVSAIFEFAKFHAIQKLLVIKDIQPNHERNSSRLHLSRLGQQTRLCLWPRRVSARPRRCKQGRSGLSPYRPAGTVAIAHGRVGGARLQRATLARNSTRHGNTICAPPVTVPVQCRESDHVVLGRADCAPQRLAVPRGLKGGEWMIVAYVRFPDAGLRTTIDAVAQGR